MDRNATGVSHGLFIGVFHNEQQTLKLMQSNRAAHAPLPLCFKRKLRVARLREAVLGDAIIMNRAARVVVVACASATCTQRHTTPLTLHHVQSGANKALMLLPVTCA